VQREDLQGHMASGPLLLRRCRLAARKERFQKQERGKAGVRAKVAHPRPVIKRQFGLVRCDFADLPGTPLTS
jgi:hypothetical protein